VDLMSLAISVFPPIIKQNELAYEAVMKDPSLPKIFHEEAFNRSLYEGKVEGFKFKSVVKTFQV